MTFWNWFTRKIKRGLRALFPQRGSPSVAGQVFISHASHDKPIAEAIGKELRAQKVPAWVDARELTAGDQLEPEIQHALEESRAVVVVLSPRTKNSKWVKKELEYALELQEERGLEYKVIAVMLDGIEPADLLFWFDNEPLGIKLPAGPGGIQGIMPDLLAALGLSLPSHGARSSKVKALPIADLTLKLSDPYIDESDGKHRGAATAELIYKPAEPGAREVQSRRFKLVAPIGPIEADELRWYLERYVIWPSGVFRERAKRVEDRLPEWGRQLHAVALEHEHAREAYEAWKRAGAGAVRQLTVLVDQELIAGAEGENQQQAQADEAAALLLALPWELLHDDESYLFLGQNPVRVRRRLPNRKAKPAIVTEAPLRVLLLSPRPEDERAAYIDHRVSARPVVEALSSLGELAELKLLSPPTFAALEKELDRARQEGKPYHVVHFDGHGVYSRHTGLGALCFESAEDSGKLERRRSDIVEATRLAEVMRDQRVPLFFLEACQTAVAEKDPTASVAGTLLQGGVASVVAMSHAVLVETARRFVTVFYRELLAGRRIGEAMVAGQRELRSQKLRYRTFLGELHLEDWFVPVLYQEEDDPQLIREVPAQRVQEVLKRRRSLSLGELPKTPEHGFLGRSRELLKAERLLQSERYVVLRGEGGEGKTTLAAELARWLVETRRYEQVAFASLEHHGEARSLLYALGIQLVENYGLRAGQGEDRGLLEVERALRERRTLLVLDNMESVLPPEKGAAVESAFEPEVLDKVLKLVEKLNAVSETRVVFTSRQPMPPPFENNHVPIGRMGRSEAIELVARVLGEAEQAPQADDPGENEDEVVQLVDAVGCHARSLVLLAREVAQSGVRNATERLGELMAQLQERYPDNRERSLYASVELSLRRLPEGVRETIRPLGVFQGGGHLMAMAMALGVDLEKPQLMTEMAKSLERVGLAEFIEYGYLRLDPALGPLLSGEMSEAEQAAARDRWATAMALVTGVLYREQSSSDPKAVSVLTLLDMANLLGALEHLGKAAPAEVVVEVATSVENMLQSLGRPKALARVSRLREAAAAVLGEWSHAKFIAEDQAVDRLLDVGRFREAILLAQSNLERAKTGGENAYVSAAYDLAMAHFTLGRALEMGGHAEAALGPLREAQTRFQALADGGQQFAAGMAAAAFTEIGDCLVRLGRLDEAALAYEEGNRRAEQLKHARSVAAGKAQLGLVRLLQRRYGEALAAYEEARQTFELLGEPSTVAISWHQIGAVHQSAGQHDEAEKAYQAALQIRVKIGDRSGEAGTLNQFGILYGERGRLEDAVPFYQKAAAVYRELADLAKEGVVCSNLADMLIKLGRHDDARRQLQRAIECKEPFGHSAEPWKALSLLAQIERASGNMTAADAARKRAIGAYLAYRRDGGQNLSRKGGIFSFIAQAIANGQLAAAESQFAQLEGGADLPPNLKALLPKLQAILRGSRDPALAGDPDLDYDDAAELELLLEHLKRSEAA